jgi:deoxyribonuclease V
MHINRLHDWNVNFEQASEIQLRLAKQIIPQNGLLSPRLIAGLDVSVNKLNEAKAVAVVLSYPELKVVEFAAAAGKVEFPYVPGYLSFRELPLTLQACEKLTLVPDLVMVDGQGLAHPRGLGLASHLGLFLDAPTIGCAKSHLLGIYKEPDVSFGSRSDMIDNQGQIIGAALRTKTAVKPLFISIGNKINLSTAVNWVLLCCKGYRLPEPTRLAHLASKGNFC